MALSQETLDLVKVIGIVGSLLIAATGFLVSAYATLKNLTSRKLLNYQEIIKSHREIWKLTLDSPEKYARILQTGPNLSHRPISYEERRFVNLLLLHITSAYAFSKENDIVKIDSLKDDIDEVMSFPIPRAVWLSAKHYFNQDFIDFIDQPAAAPRQYLTGSAALNLAYTRTWTILILTPYKEKVFETLSQFGDKLLFPIDPDMVVTLDFLEENEINIILSFGYSRILSPDVLNSVTAINLHSGFLPYDKGPNPHLWSVVNDSHRGASIHFIDEGVCTGDLIAQKLAEAPGPDATFRSSLEQLTSHCASLLSETWPIIRTGTYRRTPQKTPGSRHTLRDQEPLAELCTEEAMSLPITVFRARALALLADSRRAI